MFQVGDVVKLHPKFIGSNYLFQVWHINRDSAGFYYNLRRVEQELDLTRGSSKWQLDLIDRIEHQDWRDCELEPVESCLSSYVSTSARNDAVDSLSYAKLGYDKFQSINTFNIDTGTTVMDEFKRIQKSLEELLEKDNKEDNMEILRLYNERKSFEINNDYNIKMKEIQKEDTIQKILLEMQEQINTILESEGRAEKVDLGSSNKELLTTESKEKIEKLEVETDRKKDELHATIEEVKALFELTEDYQERMKILKRYDIIDKNGKLSI